MFSSYHVNKWVILLREQHVNLSFDLGNINAWFDVWRRDLVFSFIYVHIVDPAIAAIPTVPGKVAHVATIKA